LIIIRNTLRAATKISLRIGSLIEATSLAIFSIKTLFSLCEAILFNNPTNSCCSALIGEEKLDQATFLPS